MPSMAIRRRKKSNPLHFRAGTRPPWRGQGRKIGFACRRVRERRARTASRMTARRSNSFCHRNGSRREPAAGRTLAALARPAAAPTPATARTKWRTIVSQIYFSGTTLFLFGVPPSGGQSRYSPEPPEDGTPNAKSLFLGHVRRANFLQVFGRVLVEILFAS
jgi:hypothetical protein